jgi:altronate dehydratase
MTFLGYPRAPGAPGIRNALAVIAVELAASPLAARIADDVRGAVPLLHKQGIGHLAPDQDRIVRVLRGWAQNPNVGAVLFVDIGYGMLPVDRILDGLDGKPVEVIDAEKLGGLYRALEQGVRVASTMAGTFPNSPANPVPPGHSPSPSSAPGQTPSPPSPPTPPAARPWTASWTPGAPPSSARPRR